MITGDANKNNSSNRMCISAFLCCVVLCSPKIGCHSILLYFVCLESERSSVFTLYMYHRVSWLFVGDMKILCFF